MLPSKVIAVNLFAVFALAQGQQPLPLSLRKSIEIALAPEGNTRVEIAREAIAQAEARKDQARSALLPNLETSLGYQNATRNLNAFGLTLPSIPGFAFSSFVGPFSIIDARATVSQSVFDFSSIRRYQGAKAAIGIAQKERDNVRHAVTDQVARAYVAALRADAHVESAKANLVLSEALRDLADNQRRAGTGTGIEVTRAGVQLANERQRLQIAENDRKRAHLQLLRALDLRLDTVLELTDKLAYSALEPISVEQAVAIALKERPDFQAQQQRLHVAELNSGATRAERLPSLAAFGDYGAIGREVSESRPTRTAGISLRIPVFDGGRREARRAESVSQERAERSRTKDLREQLELEIRIAMDNLTSAELQVKTAEEGLQLSQRELEQAQRRYQAGVANSLEVTDAQTRLIRARDNRINALFQHNLARLDLGSAIGNVERYLP